MIANPMAGRVLGTDDLDVLTSVLDTFLPGDDEMPAASATGAAAAIDIALAEGPSLRAPVLDALTSVRITAADHGATFTALGEAARIAVLQAVEAHYPDAFDALLVQAYTAYYTDPAVQARLGVPSPLMPTGHPRATAGTLDLARLDRVRATARPWRQA